MDVPEALHAIWAEDEERRKRGYHDLPRRLGHGNSAFPAPIAAVPFLVDVKAGPGTTVARRGVTDSGQVCAGLSCGRAHRVGDLVSTRWL